MKNLVVYNVNSTITGTLTVNGNVPGFPIELVAMNQDSAQSITMADGTTGNFSFPVTYKIFRYEIFPVNTSQNYYYNNIIAHAGNAGVALNLSTTPLDVKPFNGNVPKQYSLGQNYPNPFNPSTTINYEIPVSGFVNLTVYSILGQKVSQLVNEVQKAGIYNIDFNSNNLSSEIYFYKLSSANYMSIKKMVFLK
ncbi:MAG: T9SS type A sorting domain-containing protein [Ignavibacteriaceae bacterium]